MQRLTKRNIKVINHDTGQQIDFPTFGKEAGEDAYNQVSNQLTSLQSQLESSIASMSEAIVTDKTLTIEDAPADAKAAGDAINNLRGAVGSPLVAATAASMTNTNKVYVYTGSETGYTNGNWYYHDGTSWVSGGVYNSVAVDLDTTLTISGKASDSKSVGDAIGELKENLDENIADLKTTTQQAINRLPIGYWDRGNIHLNTGKPVHDVTNRICTNKYVSFNYEIKLSTASGFRVAVNYIDNGAVSSQKGWVTEYTIPASQTFVLVIARVNGSENSTEVADYNVFSSALTISSAYDTSHVLYKAQPLTDEQKSVARSNIDAAPIGICEAVGYDPERINSVEIGQNTKYANPNSGDIPYTELGIQIGSFSSIDGQLNTSSTNEAGMCVKGKALKDIFVVCSNGGHNKIIFSDQTKAYSSASRVIPKNSIFRICAKYSNSAAITDLDDLFSKVKIVSVGSLQDKLKAVKTCNIADIISFEIGSIQTLPTYFNYADSTKAIRNVGGSIAKLHKGDALKIDSTNIYCLYWAYTTEGNIIFSTGFMGGLRVPADGYYLFVFKYANNADVVNTSEITDLITMYSAEYMEEQSRNYLLYPKYPTVISLLHRGMSALAPENTDIAFIYGAKYGFNYVETDVRFTSDGVPVLLHDATINRTGRNADGTTFSTTINIRDITYTQALQYDFGHWKGSVFDGTKIPKFEDFIALAKSLGLHVAVELKESDITQAEFNILSDIVKNARMENHTMWLSFYLSALTFAHAAFPKATIIYSANPSAETIQNALSLKGDNEVVFGFDIDAVTTEKMELLKAADLPVCLYTIRTNNEVLDMDKYISYVITNYPNAGNVLFNNQ